MTSQSTTNHTSNAGAVLVQTIGRALRAAAESGPRAALFRFDETTGKLGVTAVSGFPEHVRKSIGPQLAFLPGEERGIVGLVASAREPLYVRDCVTDSRWIGESRTVAIRSAYFIPLEDEGEVPSVLCLLSPSPDGFGPVQRALAHFMLDVAGKLSRNAFRVGRLEEGLQRLARELDELGVWSRAMETRFPPDILEGLRELSRREWEILRLVAAGKRVETIARDLFISPHTVRNHLKSILRKLGVGTQAELREKLGGVSLPSSGDDPNA